MTLSKSFTAKGVSVEFALKPGQTADYAVSGTFTGFVHLEQSQSPTTHWTRFVTGVVDTGYTGTLKNTTNTVMFYRFRAMDTDALTVMTGTAVTSITDNSDAIVSWKDQDGNTVFAITEAGVAVTGTMSVSGTVTADGAVTSGVGAKNGSTVSVAETGTAHIHKTVLTLTATPITLTDDAGAGQYGGVKLYDFPAGDILVLGATLDAALTLVGAQWLDTAEGDVGLGSAAVTDGDSLASTEQNIIATTAIAAMVAQVGPIDAQSTTAGVPLGAAAGTDSDLYLNIRIDDDVAHTTAASNLITGTVTMYWMNLGDF